MSGKASTESDKTELLASYYSTVANGEAEPTLEELVKLDPSAIDLDEIKALAEDGVPTAVAMHKQYKEFKEARKPENEAEFDAQYRKKIVHDMIQRQLQQMQAK